METLNTEQKYAACYEGRHLLVLAGAGTGKTRTIIARASYLLNKGVNPRRIMILSFTRKSAREIVERIRVSCKGLAGQELRGQTFHSWCMEIIKTNPDVFPQHSRTLLDEDDRESAFKLLCGKNFRDKDNHRVAPSTIIEVYSYAINACCSLSEAIRKKVYDNENLTPELKKTIDANRPVYENIIRKYMDYKNEHQYMDYDDILQIVAKGLAKNEAARNFISSRYDHILVDEMQDSNPLQYLLLKSFTERCNLFCVGDDAQSIYGFRGADFNSVHHFSELVPDSETCKLTVNYRSTQEILDLSNWLLRQSPFNYDKDLTADRGHGDKPFLLHVDSDWSEANDITDRIIESISSQSCKYSDNMVLSRSLYGLKRVEASCLEKRIPYMVFGGTSLMQSRHVRDIVSPLRIVANFRDEIAWMRYLMLWKGIGEITASRIIAVVVMAETLSQSISALAKQNLQKEITQTLESIADMQSFPSNALKKTYEIMEPRMKEIYKDEWDWRKTDFPILEEVALNVGGISEFISEYVLDPKLETTTKEKGKDDDCCILSTIHSAKGLEAANCYIVNVSPAAYPTPRAVLNGEEAVEEERRCLYVAMTRAKDRLYIYRNLRSIHTDECNSADSYFLDGLPENLVESGVKGTAKIDFDGDWYTGERVSDSIGDDFDFS